jgi:hypothetical protein
MEDKRNQSSAIPSSQHGHSSDHVDLINEFMQNKERRNFNNGTNYGFSEWLDSSHVESSSFGSQGNGQNYQEWLPAEHHHHHHQPQHNEIDSYYMEYGNAPPEQNTSSFPSYDSNSLQPSPYYGDMSALYHSQHDPMNRGTQQPASRHRIQQVHPRNSTLHTTNIGMRPQQQPSPGLFTRNGSYSPSLPPPNLLVHQQYRPPSRPYEERYHQHTPPPAPTQGPQYGGMSSSHYDLSAHVRNQGALNWSTGNVQVASGNNGSRQQQNATNRIRYPQQQPNQMPYQNANPVLNSANYLGNSNQGRPQLSPAAGGNGASNAGNQRTANNNPPPPSSNATSLINRSNDMAGRDIELEQLIYRNAKAILAETANRCLKSVELANALRDRIGKEALQRTKVLYGGLLVLLELYRETFAVHRIPKNDMVELLAYVAPQYASHSIQHPQQLLASQIPGYNISAPNLTSNNSFANGSVIAPNTSAPGANPLSSSPKFEQPVPTLYHSMTSQQIPTKCLFISNVPDDITGNEIWAEFGGEDIVEKVSVDYQGDQRTGVIWFTSINAAKAALNIPSLIKWKDVLSFVDPEDVAPPPAVPSPDTPGGEIDTFDSHSPLNSNKTSSTSSQPSFDDAFGPPPGLSEPTPTSYGRNQHSSNTNSSNSIFDVSVTMTEDGQHQQGSSHGGRGRGDNGDDRTFNLHVDFSSFGILDSNETSLSAGADSGTNVVVTTSTSTPSSVENSPKGSFRKAAPPPIVTADLTTHHVNDQQIPQPQLTGRSSVQSLSPGPSPTSTPGGTPHLSFTFFDTTSTVGLTTLPRETLPKPIHDVMNTLCDVYYVPQKTWEKSSIGDYLFCQAIIDILSGQFNGVFVQMTKLKQQLKRKLGGSIRIGPLKALVIAYPEYFEVDRTVNLVRSLKTELPYMDISVITSA